MQSAATWESQKFAGSYGFEYSDEEMSEGAVDIENQYYNSKGLA